MIRITEIKDPLEWKKGLNNFEFSILITPEWIESFADKIKKPIYFDFIGENAVIGKISGLIINYRNSKNKFLFFFSGPAVNVSGRDIIPLILDELLEYAISNKYKRLIVKSYDYKMTYKVKRNILKLTNSKEYVVDLLQSKEEIQNNFSRLLLRKLKTASKSRAEFTEGDSLEMMNNMISLLEETKRIRLSRGYPDYSYFYIPYLDKIILNRVIRNNITKLYYVKVNDEITCITLILVYSGKAYALLIGANEKAYNLGIPYFIMSCIIQELKDKQFEYFNLGGIPKDKSGEGLVIFKKSFGTREVPVSNSSTNYLILPYKLLNPLLNLGRKLPGNKLARTIKEYYIYNE